MSNRATASKMEVAFTTMIGERIEAGWSPYFLSLGFEQISDNRSVATSVMHEEIDRMYRTMLTRVVRRPRHRAALSLPLLIAAPDLPVGKKNKSAGALLINAGLHAHAALLLPPDSRLDTSLVEHVAAQRRLYVGRFLRSIDVQPIDRDVRRVTNYVLKSVRRGLPTDDVLILPRARSESMVRNGIEELRHSSRSQRRSGSTASAPTGIRQTLRRRPSDSSQ